MQTDSNSSRIMYRKNDNGWFVVASANMDGLLYTVSFDDGGMPICERFDWKRFHLACKHFCAIFHLFPDSGWNALASDY